MPRQGSHWLHAIDEPDQSVFNISISKWELEMYQQNGYAEGLTRALMPRCFTVATVVGPVTRRKGAK